MQFIY